MRATVEVPNPEAASSSFSEEEARKAQAILEELDRILASRYFRSAGRSRQFLQYVVHHKLAGHVEQLKERTIGAEVFHRSPGYATGEDPVVRVQAGEVRRRLEQYYQTAVGDSPLSIKLPLGSYSPVFHWAGSDPPAPAPQPSTVPPAQPTTRPAMRWAIMAICAIAVAVVSVVILQPAMRRKTTIEKFWGPVFATQQPVIIGLARPVLYRPSLGLYQRYARSHPGTFQTEVERFGQALPLDPNEKLVWSDININPEYGVAVGDAYAALSLSGLLGRIGKPSQVRFGSDYSFEDLRNSPAVVVGAFNNRWTMKLTANLHFAFLEQNGEFTIQEQTPGGRIWKQFAVDSGEPSDAAIVARLLDSRTGQFMLVVAGIDATGTRAAADFVSNPQSMEKGLRDAPAGWQKSNVELILQTTITDATAGPPRVVAAYYW